MISLVDLAGLAISLTAIAVLWGADRKRIRSFDQALILGIVLIEVVINLGNFLEWSRITSVFDTFEDYLNVLMAAMWGFFLVSLILARYEEAYRVSEARYGHLFDNTPLPMMVLDEGTLAFLDVNLAAVEHYGYSREEFLKLTARDIRPPEDVDSALRKIHSLEGSAARVGVWRHRKKDGTVIMVDIRSIAIVYDGSPARLVLCNDVTEQISARQALADSEERFKTAFRTGPDPMVILRMADRSIIDANESFYSNAGYLPGEILGKTTPDLDLWIDLEGRPRFYRELQEKGSVDNLEADFRLKSGRTVSSLISARPMTLQGEEHLLVIVKDISRLKEVEARLRASLSEKDVLLGEIYNRVKNNLQVISGLLNLQAHHIRDPAEREAYKASQNRVSTMAMIHGELDWSRDLVTVDFAEHVGNLARNLWTSYSIDPVRIKLSLDTQSLQVAADTAIPVGLIVNELVSNALAHAFPQQRQGRVWIGFKSAGTGRYQLVVGDDGIGLPGDLEVRKARSLGLKLVSVLSEQLGAALVVEREGGTVFRMTFDEYREAGTGGR